MASFGVTFYSAAAAGSAAPQEISPQELRTFVVPGTVRSNSVVFFSAPFPKHWLRLQGSKSFPPGTKAPSTKVNGPKNPPRYPDGASLATTGSTGVCSLPEENQSFNGSLTNSEKRKPTKRRKAIEAKPIARGGGRCRRCNCCRARSAKEKKRKEKETQPDKLHRKNGGRGGGEITFNWLIIYLC